MSISEMLNSIDSLRKKECGSGATGQEMAEAEETLGVRFPASYKAFLSTYGWARIHHDVLFGVGRRVDPADELVKTTLSERYELGPHIPHHLVPIMNDGAGNNYCLDTSHFHGDECPIVFWDHEHEDGPDQTPQQVSASFDQWLIDRIADSPYADNP
jgi:cell wall assembly regulator SMI1